MTKKRLLPIILLIVVSVWGIYGGIQSDLSNNSQNSSTNTDVQNPVKKPETNMVYLGAAEDLASIVKNSPDIANSVDDVAKVTQIITLYNQIVQIIDINPDRNLPTVNVDENSVKMMIKYAPLIGPAVDLRMASFNLNPNDASSVDAFYFKLGNFIGDTAALSTGAIDLIPKESTTVVLNVLKDSKFEEKVVSMCKTDCTRQFKESTNYFVSALSGQILPTITNSVHYVINPIRQIFNSQNFLTNK